MEAITLKGCIQVHLGSHVFKVVVWLCMLKHKIVIYIVLKFLLKNYYQLICCLQPLLCLVRRVLVVHLMLIMYIMLRMATYSRFEIMKYITVLTVSLYCISN